MAASHHWPTNEQGILLNRGDRAKIQPVFQPLIDEAVQACVQAIEGDLHSLYLVGSMARGEAQPGQSDFDFIAVLEYSVDPELVKHGWIRPLTTHLQDRYSSLITDVEFDMWPQGYLFRDPAEFSPGAFLLTTQSVCVWGSDLVPELPHYTLKHLPTCRAIANEDLLYFGDDLADIAEMLQGTPSVDDVRALSRKLGKKLARAGFALALEKNRKYTRDIVQCVADFSRVYQADVASMQRALSLYTTPTNDVAVLQSMLDGFADALAVMTVDWLDVYNPDWEEFYPTGEEDEDTDA